MRIIAKSTLRLFWENPAYTDSEQSLKVWYDEVKKAAWSTFNDLKEDFPTASIVVMVEWYSISKATITG